MLEVIPFVPWNPLNVAKFLLLTESLFIFYSDRFDELKHNRWKTK